MFFLFFFGGGGGKFNKWLNISDKNSDSEICGKIKSLEMSNICFAGMYCSTEHSQFTNIG